jgi:hypothetical protein
MRWSAECNQVKCGLSLVRKKFSRTQLLAYTANLPSSLIGLEACSGAHFLGAALDECKQQRSPDQTPHRFRTKRQLWTYSGLGLETHDSAQYQVVGGQLQHSNRVTLRGLNKNHNHDLKAIFKGAAIRATIATGPLHNFYEGLLAKGKKPTMARLTLARKIAAITLIIWKKEVRFDAEHLKQQAA